jgi:hypothetical protein
MGPGTYFLRIILEGGRGDNMRKFTGSGGGSGGSGGDSDSDNDPIPESNSSTPQKSKELYFAVGR